LGLAILAAVPTCSTTVALSATVWMLASWLRGAAILSACIIGGCGRKTQAQKSSVRQPVDICAVPSALSDSEAERTEYLHGEHGTRRGIARPLQWLDEPPLANTHQKERIYRLVDVYELNASSLRIEQGEDGCWGEARVADRGLCTSKRARARISDIECNALINCVEDGGFWEQPPDSTSRNGVKVQEGKRTVVITAVEARTFYWFEGMIRGKYHIAIRDWSSPANSLEECARKWSEWNLSLLSGSDSSAAPR
jgi:hypothetical protein